MCLFLAKLMMFNCYTLEVKNLKTFIQKTDSLTFLSYNEQLMFRTQMVQHSFLSFRKFLVHSLTICCFTPSGRCWTDNEIRLIQEETVLT